MIYEKIYIKVEKYLDDYGIGISSNGRQWTIFMSFEQKKDAVELAKLLSDFCKKKNIKVWRKK